MNVNSLVLYLIENCFSSITWNTWNQNATTPTSWDPHKMGSRLTSTTKIVEITGLFKTGLWQLCILISQEILPQRVRPYTKWRFKICLRSLQNFSSGKFAYRCSWSSSTKSCSTILHKTNPSHSTSLKIVSSNQGTSSVLLKKEKKKKSIQLFGFHMEPILKESKISLTNIHKTIILKTPPWII